MLCAGDDFTDLYDAPKEWKRCWISVPMPSTGWRKESME
jgi:hypothetical protein